MTDVPAEACAEGREPRRPASTRDYVYGLVVVIVVIALVVVGLIWLLTGFDSFCCGTRPLSSPR